MIQLFLILIMVLVALRLKEEHVLILVLALLPFHVLLKSLFNVFSGGSSIIALWKEIVLLVLFIRVIYSVYISKTMPLNTLFPKSIILSYVIAVTILFFTAQNKQDALTSYKNFVLPLLVFFTAMHIPFSINAVKKLMYSLGGSAFLVFIIAHLQQHVFSFEFAFLMDAADSFTEQGEISFTQSASKIMGIQRMYGPFIGPNELGLYTSLLLTILLGYLLLNKEKLLLWIVIYIAGCLTLLQTFSRVSWFIFSVSFFALMLKRLVRIKYLLFSVFLFVCILLLVSLLTPDLSRIFEASVKFEEASAQGRPDDFMRGLKVIADNPFGFGLGTVQYNAGKRLFETEIFWWLVFGELGLIIGGVQFIIYFFVTYLLFSNQKKQNIFAIAMPLYMSAVIIAGFLSIILFEPIFQVYLWSCIGLAMNFTVN